MPMVNKWVTDWGFSHNLAKRLHSRYTFGKGYVYKLNCQELADLHVLPIGLHTPGLWEKVQRNIECLEPGQSEFIEANAQIGFAATAGTLNQAAIMVRGVVSKNECGWNFQGEIKLAVKYDFDPQDDTQTGARAEQTNFVRSESGEFQARIGNAILSGTNFRVESEWIPASQNNSDSYFEVFEGTSYTRVPSNFEPEIKFVAKKLR